MATSFKRSRAHTASPSAPTLQQATTDTRLCQRLLDIHWLVWVSLLWGSLLLSSGSCCIQGFVCSLQDSVLPVLCKFWRLYGGVNGDLLKEGLCHTQVCCTQSPDPCALPLLTCISAEDPQTLKADLAQYLSYLLVYTRSCLIPLRVFGGYGG